MQINDVNLEAKWSMLTGGSTVADVRTQIKKNTVIYVKLACLYTAHDTWTTLHHCRWSEVANTSTQYIKYYLLYVELKTAILRPAVTFQSLSKSTTFFNRDWSLQGRQHAKHVLSCVMRRQKWCLYERRRQTVLQFAETSYVASTTLLSSHRQIDSDINRLHIWSTTWSSFKCPFPWSE